MSYLLKPGNNQVSWQNILQFIYSTSGVLPYGKCQIKGRGQELINLHGLSMVEIRLGALLPDSMFPCCFHVLLQEGEEWWQRALLLPSWCCSGNHIHMRTMLEAGRARRKQAEMGEALSSKHSHCI